ncbi:response regulator [Microcella sp.]|uniref:response regulator n=1 Tax=Microcella sp. TaxID=1913979 RepID=UPI00299F6A0E|nr:response regulator [Microcella sp.]MDX2026962.1 response regulator [Microcella sp.]
MRILLADDDRQMVRALSISLRAEGYEVITAHDGREALDAATHQHPDLIVLDLGMPGLTGVEVITAVRGWSEMPVLVISGRAESWDKVEALDAGADDYVTKPFAIDELLARVRALARRSAPTGTEAPTIQFADVRVDLANRQVLKAEKPVRLTPTEWRLLEELLRHPGKLITRETLLTSVWGPLYTTDSGYLRLYMSQLRKKLEPEPSHPRHLLTEAGMGYRFVNDPGLAAETGA